MLQFDQGSRCEVESKVDATLPGAWLETLGLDPDGRAGRGLV